MHLVPASGVEKITSKFLFDQTTTLHFDCLFSVSITNIMIKILFADSGITK
jgi:hypothetical protein